MSRRLLLGALAAVFTIALTFASVELPYLVDDALQAHVATPGFDSQADEVSRLKTELFIAHYHIRAIGYLCLGTVVVLIGAGFASRRAGLALLGGLVFMLPVFAQFASVMFFLAGLGLLNVAWLPVLDWSFDLGALGAIAWAPYDVLAWLAGLVGIRAYWPAVYGFLGAGLLIFFLGTFSWLRARVAGHAVAGSGVYRLSRHPQYLGWILWSYGMLLLLLRARYPRRSWAISPTLPWLVSTVVIVGVAMLEELGMRRRHGPEYEAYRRSAPFLVPLPRIVERSLALPSRILFRKEAPDRPREVAVLLLLSTGLLMAASFLVYGGAVGQIRAAFRSPHAQQVYVASLVDRLRREPDGRWTFRVVSALADAGETSVDARLDLLTDEDPRLRAHAARALMERPDARAIPLLTEALGDPWADVRLRAVEALSAMESAEAVGPVLPLIRDPSVHVRLRALEALAVHGARDVLGPTTELLQAPEPWVRVAALGTLGTLRAEDAVPAVSACLRDTDPAVRRDAAVALLRIGSSLALPALADAHDDEDWEVRLYAAEALKRLGRAHRSTS